MSVLIQATPVFSTLVCLPRVKLAFQRVHFHRELKGRQATCRCMWKKASRVMWYQQYVTSHSDEVARQETACLNKAITVASL